MRIPLLRVTKGSTDGTVRVGDRVYYAPDGSLVLAGEGFITRDELTDEIRDFEYVVDDEHDVVIVGGSEIVVKKEITGTKTGSAKMKGIKVNIDMPESCAACPMCHPKGKSHPWEFACFAIMEDVDVRDFDTKRLPSCPIVVEQEGEG